MTTSNPFVKAVNGLVHITDPHLDFDALENALAEYRAADKLADEDYDARRLTRHEQITRPAADSAADAVRDEAGLQITWEQALAMSDELYERACDARKQQQAAERAARISPLLRKA